MTRLTLLVTTLFAATTTIEAATFDFTTGIPMPPSVFGNSITLTDDGIQIVMTGWSVADGSSAARAGQVKVWNTGVGMCSVVEGINCGSGPHTVGNQTDIDLLFMQFSAPVLLDSALITAWANDFDVSFWGGPGVFNLAGEWNLASLGTQHNDFFGSNNASAGNTTRTVDLTGIGTPVSWLAFGAYTGHSNDKFKFKVLTVSVPTPEPGLLVFLAAGTLALIGRKRRARLDRDQ